MYLSDFNIEQIRAQHANQIVESFDIGRVTAIDPETGASIDVRALDVLVWESEEDAENDDGTRAVARYLIRA